MSEAPKDRVNAWTLGGDRSEPVSRPRLALFALVIGLLIGGGFNRWGRDRVIDAYVAQNEELRLRIVEQAAAARFCEERIGAVWPKQQ